MNQVHTMQPALCRLLKSSRLNPSFITCKTFSWQKYANDSVKNSFVRATRSHDYVPNRNLGWLLASKLKPGQRGYEKQQKMYRRCNLIWISCSIAFSYYMFVNGYFTNFMGIPVGDPSKFWSNREREQVEEKLRIRREQDADLLRRAEIRKENIEKILGPGAVADSRKSSDP